MKKLIVFAGIACLTAMLVLPLAAQAQSKTFNIKWASVLAPTDPNNVVAQEVIAKIKERTKGGVDISLFPASQLGKASEMFAQQKIGAPIIAETVPSWSADLGYPKYQMLDGPFLYDSPAKIDKLMESPVIAKWNEEFTQATGIKVLTWNWFGGYRHILAHKGFPSPAELKGVKFRVPESPVWLKTFELLGATPVTTPWAEIYNALSTGVVDAMESPLAAILSVKLQEVAKTATLSGHFAAVRGFQISEKLFASMPADYQKIMLEEFKAGGVKVTKMMIENHDTYVKQLTEAGVKFVTPDLAQYKAKVQPFYTEEKTKWSAEDYKQVLEALK
jgi:tripartite ATP-independent transporter DctP family solute receptor